MIGFLWSQEEFSFKESHLAQMSMLVHVNFLVFMQVVLGKMSHVMLTSNYWARALQQIVAQKVKYKQVDGAILGSQGYKNSNQPNRKADFSLSSSQAATELDRNSTKLLSLLASMISRCKCLALTTPTYTSPVFNMAAEVIEHIDALSFKQAANIIGGSLVAEFNEIQSQGPGMDYGGRAQPG
jgi:hypothetical protein